MELSLFAFSSSIKGFHGLQVTNEKKILIISVKQNMNRKISRILSKIARLINISD